MAELVPFPKDDRAPINAQKHEDTKRDVPRPDDRSRFSNEEVSEIIRVALRNVEGRQTNTVTAEEMEAIGKDFGLTAADLRRAYEQIGASQAVRDQTSKAMLGFKVHAMCYLAVNLSLFGINMVADPSFWWFVYPLLAWSGLLAIHWVGAKYVPAFTTTILERKAAAIARGCDDPRTIAYREDIRAEFTIPEVFGELAKARGLAQIRGNDLLLEYEVADALLGLFKSRVKETAIPLDEIESVRLDRRVWSTKLTLQGRKMRSFAGIPGTNTGRLTLVFDKDRRQASERLARALADAIS